jgi:hypothetical protein
MNAARISRLALRGVLLVSLGFGINAFPGSEVASERPPWGLDPRQDTDVTASAIPADVYPEVTDEAFGLLRTSGWRFKADATATASSTCAGCRGDAATLQVVFVRPGSRGTVDNIATAWSQCKDCTATALSVQVVVLRGDPEIRANNRALALNAACEGCGTASAAFQLVVEGGHTAFLSPGARRDLEQWVEEQAAVLRQQARSAQLSGRIAQDPTDAALRDLDGLVSGVLGTDTLERRAQFRSRNGVTGPRPDRTRGFAERRP